MEVEAEEELPVEKDLEEALLELPQHEVEQIMLLYLKQKETTMEEDFQQ